MLQARNEAARMQAMLDATPTAAPAHVAIKEAQDGPPITWEHVDDKQCHAASTG